MSAIRRIVRRCWKAAGQALEWANCFRANGSEPRFSWKPRYLPSELDKYLDQQVSEQHFKKWRPNAGRHLATCTTANDISEDGRLSQLLEGPRVLARLRYSVVVEQSVRFLLVFVSYFGVEQKIELTSLRKDGLAVLKLNHVGRLETAVQQLAALQLIISNIPGGGRLKNAQKQWAGLRFSVQVLLMTSYKYQLLEKVKRATPDGRYDAAAVGMKAVANIGVGLSGKELRIFCKAVSAVVGRRWEEIKQTTPSGQPQLRTALREQLFDLQVLINQKLLPTTSSAKRRLVYVQLRGDCSRYLAAMATGLPKKLFLSDAQGDCERGFQICRAKLRAAHPVRLRLALNLVAFYIEYLGAADLAQETAFLEYVQAAEDMSNLDGYTSAFQVSSRLLDMLVDTQLLPTEVPQSDLHQDKDILRACKLLCRMECPNELG